MKSFGISVTFPMMPSIMMSSALSNTNEEAMNSLNGDMIIVCFVRLKRVRGAEYSPLPISFTGLFQLCKNRTESKSAFSTYLKLMNGLWNLMHEEIFKK